MVKKTLHLQAAKQAGGFVIDTALVAVPLYLFFSATKLLHYVAALLSQLFLSGLGKTATIAYNIVPYLRLPGLEVEISDLCSGGLELALLFGFIYASKDRNVQHRIKGAIVGLVFFVLFNAARIAFTVNTFGTAWFEPLHEALFRAVLIIGLVSFYAIWYYWPHSRNG